MDSEFARLITAGGPPDPRLRIARALYDCMRANGYAETSLKDIALAAGMTPSHVRYYFPTKLAILETLFERIVSGLLADLDDVATLTPPGRMNAIVDYFFRGEKVDREDLGIFFQIFGVAVQDERLRATKRRWDEAMIAFFTRLFGETPRAEGWSATEAAEAALAAMVGLRMKTYYGDDRDLSAATAVCRLALLRLAGLRE